MPNLIQLEDGTVRWDYDVPVEKPKKAAKKAATVTESNHTEES